MKNLLKIDEYKMSIYFFNQKHLEPLFSSLNIIPDY